MDPIDSFPMSANRDGHHSFLPPQRTSKRSGGVAIASIFRSRFTTRRPNTFCNTSISLNSEQRLSGTCPTDMPDTTQCSNVKTRLLKALPECQCSQRTTTPPHAHVAQARHGPGALLQRKTKGIECCHRLCWLKDLSSTVLAELSKKNVHFFPFGMLIWFSTHTTNSFRHGGGIFSPKALFLFSYASAKALRFF